MQTTSNLLKNSLEVLDMEIAAIKTFGNDLGLENANYEQFVKKFEESMDDDFNTPKALAVLHEFSNYINKVVYETKLESLEIMFNTFKRLCSVLGFFEKYKRVPILDKKSVELIMERETARKEKNFEKADKIRDLFKNNGIQLIDTPRGTRWKLVDLKN